MAKNTYGTGCFLLMNTGEAPVASKHNLLATVGWGVEGRVAYCLEGSVFSAGAAVQYLRDSLRVIDSAAQSEDLALSVSSSGGVYFVLSRLRGHGRSVLGPVRSRGDPGADAGQRPGRDSAPRSSRSHIKPATSWRP